ncbi:uncharacterized protein LOC111355259 [Spodoptera litura]|uniref:Uncharacterized protein LOC111355259 n=1 Tax=Spodoptera litura TaxID=69820 RepID=A0A9J7E5K2_SPOLT|nr:uncharacterized protein LOC111355259 [Spodoptera litura]
MDIIRINELIKSQENDYIELKRTWDNIKKDSSSRKNQKYITERRAKLNSVYERASQNHRLLQDQEILSTHKYLTLNYFDTHIQTMYDAVIDHLKECEDKLHQTKKVSDIKINDDKQEDMTISPKLFVQKYRLNQLKKKIETAKTAVVQQKPAWQLQALINNLEKLFQDIEETHIQLLMEQSTIDDEYFNNDCFTDAQEQFEEIIQDLHEQINDKTVQTSRNHPTKLPRINIPTFAGNYESWNSFYDLFKKIIDENCTISTTEKMQYLKTHVRGDAEKLIKHLTVNEVNYKAALTLLENRYKDERKITQTFIDKLIDLPKIQTPNAKMLRNMHDCINESLEALKTQNINISTWSPILTRMVNRKWDPDTNMRYEDQLQEPNKLQDFKELMKFLEKRFKSLESSANMTTTNDLHSTYSPNMQGKTNWQEKKGLCWYCQKDHNIHYCQAFKALHVNDRIRKVQEKQMCYVCLMHDAKKECISNKYKHCEICNKAHSTLLHRNTNEYLLAKQQGQNSITKNTNQVTKPGTSTTYDHKSQITEKKKIMTHATMQLHNSHKTILLATALVQSKTFDGTPLLLRVLCDQGSEASLCTEEVAQLLGFPKQKIKAEINGIADNIPKTSNYMIDVTLQPRFPSEYKLSTSLIVLPKLTSSVPKENVQKLDPQKIENKIIADPTYYKQGPIDIILGAEEYSKILLQGFEKIDSGIISQNTEFGWILSGFCSTEPRNTIKILSLITRADEIQLNKFWELEDITENHQLNKEDQQCEQFYKDTTQRNKNGTYTVRLPFKDPSLEYGNTRQKAAARLIQLEKRLEKNKKLREKYNDFMKEYINMNHMIKVNKTNNYEGKYYIPHQPVIREDALTTKLRCVFDASSKSNTKISLNDNLHKGPRLQQDLATILLRWRKHKVVFMADIEKMYRFIKIHREDQPFQRILWRWTINQPIEEYELTTVTYGTTAAPYLAIRTLQQLATDEQKTYPLASKITLEDFYVDDVLSGDESIEKAKYLQNQLTNMLRAGGFNLRKWSSNSAELLENIPVENVDDKTIKLPLDENRKSLGVIWAPNEDSFQFKITITTTENPTKKNIFSEIAKLFDPHGWLQPVLITMKLLIQEIWISGIDWNEQVPERINKKWTHIQQQLHHIEKIRIPRWLQYTTGVPIELHGFSDASEKAYGAVVYCRTKVNNTTYRVSLLQAKSKVAPKKHKTTLPRLELCAAAL